MLSSGFEEVLPKYIESLQKEYSSCYCSRMHTPMIKPKRVYYSES